MVGACDAVLSVGGADESAAAFGEMFVIRVVAAPDVKGTHRDFCHIVAAGDERTFSYNFV